jgi:hypothetical protein
VIFGVLTALKMSVLVWVELPCGLVDTHIVEKHTVLIFRVDMHLNPDAGDQHQQYRDTWNNCYCIMFIKIFTFTYLN